MSDFSPNSSHYVTCQPLHTPDKLGYKPLMFRPGSDPCIDDTTDYHSNDSKSDAKTQDGECNCAGGIELQWKFIRYGTLVLLGQILLFFTTYSLDCNLQLSEWLESLAKSVAKNQ